MNPVSYPSYRGTMGQHRAKFVAGNQLLGSELVPSGNRVQLSQLEQPVFGVEQPVSPYDMVQPSTADEIAGLQQVRDNTNYSDESAAAANSVEFLLGEQERRQFDPTIPQIKKELTSLSTQLANPNITEAESVVLNDSYDRSTGILMRLESEANGYL